MTDDFLSKFMGSQNRARVLRVFVLDQMTSLMIADIAKRSGLSQKAAATEVHALEKMGVVRANGKAKEQTWSFNMQGKHASAISRFIHEVSPPRHDNIVSALRGTGRPTAVILSGCFVGDLSRPADLIVAADALNERRLERAVRTLEPAVGREIRYAAFSTPEFRYRLTIQDKLIRNTLDYPHLVLLDRTRML